MESNSNVSFQHSPKLKGPVLGFLLIIAGVLFLSFNFGWIDPLLRPVFFSWPMVFVVLSFVNFAKRNYSMGIIFLILGSFFLLPRIADAYPGLIPFISPGFTHNFWPVLLIVLGLFMIFRIGNYSRHKRCNFHRTDSDPIENSNGRIQKSVVFGGSENIFLDPVFYGGTIEATFGGVVLDLRRTTLPEGETCLDITATFGGVELYIPGDWMIETRFHTVLGGVEDKRLVSQPDYSRKLVLTGNLTFGGCEIR